MSSGLFNRGKEKGKTITDTTRRGRGGASGSGGTPTHTPIPSSNSIQVRILISDYVPEDITEEQINEMLEASKSIHNIEDNEDGEQEQPTKPKQRKPPELKSPLFAVHATIAIKYTSLEKEEITEYSMAICKDNIPIKLASSLIKPNSEARQCRLIPSIKFLVVLYLLLILLFRILVSGMHIKKIYPESEQRYQSNAYQELENYLTTSDLGALERGPGGNNNLLKWWTKRSTIFHVVATIAKEILTVLASTIFVEQAFSVGGYILYERRSRLTPQNLEAQTLLNDWVKAELRQQEVNYNEQEASDSYDTESSNDSINLDD
ncbi:hypothetical protein OROMI_023927 [Orobanche minor]